MNAKIWGIIGGVALVLALLSPLVLGSAQKVERLFEAAEALYERLDYEAAIAKYKEALKESKKFGAKTERIDKDFTTLANLKIARCYYELAEDSSDIGHYHNALTHIRKVVLKAQVPKHQEELTYLWAETLYKTGDIDQAKSKFLLLIEKFPNSRWVEKALYTIAEINYQQQDYDTARETFQRFLAEFPHSEFKMDVEQRIIKIDLLSERRKSSEESDDDDHDPFKLDAELQAETMYNNARALKQQGNVNAALQRYIDFVTQYPDSQYATKAYVDMGDLYFKMRDSKNARNSYEKALDRLVEEDTEEEKKEIYEKYQSTYFIPQYISDDSKIEALTPREDKALVKANLLRAQRLYAEAAQQYVYSANTNPSVEDVVYALYWAGRCYHHAALTDVTFFSKSVNAFRRLINHYADSSHTIEAYYHLTLVYIDWAQTPGYASEWESVIKTVEEANMKYTDSDNASDQRLLGRMEPFKNRALIKIKKQDQTEDDSQSEHDSKTTDKETNSSKNDREENHKTFRQTNADREKTKEKHYGQGLTYLNQNQYAQAIIQFQNAIELDSQFKEAHCNLAVAYIEQGSYEQAIPPLQEATRIDPDFIEAYFNLGIAYLRLGRFEAARNAANAALNINPNYEPAQDLLDSIAD